MAKNRANLWKTCSKQKIAKTFRSVGIVKYVIVFCITRLENVIVQVRARLVGRGVSRGATIGSTCKTFSSRVIHKIFSTDDLFKAKHIIFVTILPDREFICLRLATYKIQEATVTPQKSINSSNIQNRRRSLCHS
jgi:hypothetical protein